MITAILEWPSMFRAEDTGLVQRLRSGLMVAGRYRLEDRLGAGGMSEVWRGYDEVLGRPVAVKVLAAPLAADVSLRDLIRLEARAMARLSHPNVTSVFDYGEFTLDGASMPFVVMELMSGQTLAQLLADGPRPWPEAVHIAAQVAAALSAAHRLGLVHCDVTPANVMLTADGVKVLDFGVAAVLGGARDPNGQPRFGTPGYIAPERRTGAPDGPAVDVYGLGALLFTALVGRTPRVDGSDPQVLSTMAGLPVDAAAMCLRCLADRPQDRPGAYEVARALEAAVPAGGEARSVAASILAPVVSTPGRGTRPLPAPDPDPNETVPVVAVAPHGDGWPRPLLLAVAVVTAGLLLAGAYLLSANPAHREPLSQAPTATPATTTTPRATPNGPPSAPGREVAVAVFDLRRAVLDGRAVGEIRASCAEDLLDRIADLQRRIDRRQQDNALQRVDQIREDIDDCAADGDITRGRAATLRAELAAIVV